MATLEPHTKIGYYTDELISIPKAHPALELQQDDRRLELVYRDRKLVWCFLTR